MAGLIENFGLIQIGSEFTWLFLLFSGCCGPIIAALLYKKFDPFEPVYPVMIATIIYYGLMVFVLMQTDGFYLNGIDYSSEIAGVVFMALTAFVGFLIGYYGGKRDIRQIAVKAELTKDERVFLNKTVWILLAFFVAIFGLWVLISGVSIASLWIFGDAWYNAWKLEMVGTNVGHLFIAIETFPACLLLIIATRPHKRWPMSPMILIAFTTFLYATIGVRAQPGDLTWEHDGALLF